LVTNAIKHAGPRCQVSVRSTAPNELTLSVSDTGPGPAAENRYAGMGSRIVRAYVEQLQARIETKTLPGGYTVEVIIPLPVQ
jgi:two-component sensor histidine kinase